jgi:hypothetical protein
MEGRTVKRCLLLIIIVVLSLGACVPQDIVVQTKIAETNAAKPTLEPIASSEPLVFETFTPLPSMTPLPSSTATPTETPLPTITLTPTPLPELETVVITFDELNEQLPNFYNDFPADTGVSLNLSGLEYESFEITYLARYERGNLSITLLRFGDEASSSAVSSELESEHKKNNERRIPIPDVGLPEEAWQFYLEEEDFLTLGFSQGRIVSLFFLKEPLEMVLDNPENFLGKTGVVQMEKIIKAGY